MRPTRVSRRGQEVDGDLDTPAVIKATVKAELGDLAEIRLPDECDEPILAAPVRKAVFEWMTETRMKAELKAVGLKPRHTCLLYGPPGCGKAQPRTAPVLMADGSWRPIGDLSIGDELASVDGASSVVTGVFPRGVLDVYEVGFSDDARVECASDHLWEVHCKEWRLPKVVDTGDLASMLLKPSLAKRLYVPLVSGDFGRPAHLPLEPYLLGLLLGDGSLAGHSCVEFSAPDPEVLRRIEAALPASDELRVRAGYDYRITRKRRNNQPSAVRLGLDSLGLSSCKSYDKFIPAAYLAADKETRRRLLMGLLDTDGHTEKGNKVCFSTSSPQMAADVVRLVNSLGGLASVQQKSPTYSYRGEKRTGAPAFVINFLTPFGRDLATLPRHMKNLAAFDGSIQARRKIVSVERSAQRAEMVCIKVSHPSETYVTNNYVVTHNTTLAHHFAARLGLPLIIANGEMIHSKYVGATGENVFRFFKLLRRLEGKVVGFFDELDSLGGARLNDTQSAGKEQNAIVTALLTNIEGFSGLFFAATNRADALDQALWRRFGMQIEVALPDFEERYAIIKRYFVPFEVDSATLDELALLTRGAAPSLLRQLVEGLKRALVLGPKLKRDTSDLVELVRLVTTQVAPHPDYLKPPHTPPLLWDGAEDHTVALAGKPWPPERKAS